MATLQAMVVNQNSGPSSGSRGPDAVAGFYGGKFFFLEYFLLTTLLSFVPHKYFPAIKGLHK